MEERVRESGLDGLRGAVRERKSNEQAFPFRLEAQRYLFEKEGLRQDLVALAAEYRQTAAVSRHGPDGMGRDECLCRSLELYRDALRMDGSASQKSYALVGAAAVLADIGNLDKAFEFCTVVLDEFPNDEAAQNVMGRVEAPWTAP